MSKTRKNKGYVWSQTLPYIVHFAIPPRKLVKPLSALNTTRCSKSLKVRFYITGKQKTKEFNWKLLSSSSKRCFQWENSWIFNSAQLLSRAQHWTRRFQTFHSPMEIPFFNLRWINSIELIWVKFLKFPLWQNVKNWIGMKSVKSKFGPSVNNSAFCACKIPECPALKYSL